MIRKIIAQLDAAIFWAPPTVAFLAVFIYYLYHR